MSEAGKGAVERDSPYAWMVAWLLMGAFTVSFIDRQVLNLLIEPIKKDLGATDTQMSLLQGIGFIVSYLAFNPVFGRIVDTMERRYILILGVVTWSLFTVLCGFATNLEMLFVGRFGVGAAEAALGPAAGSILADYFTKERLPRAVSIHFLGPYFGGGLALIFGGVVIGSTAGIIHLAPFLAGLEPWQVTFVVVGMVGVVFAPALLLIREPPRTTFTGPTVLDDRRFSLNDVVAFIWTRRSFFLRYYAMMALIITPLYILPAWIPTLLIRVYGASPQNVGIIYGGLVLVAGSVGVLAGPSLNALLAKRWPRTSLLICAISAACALTLTCALIPFAPTYAAALALVTFATFCYSLPQAVASTVLQIATPNRMRGVVMSIYTLILTGFGLGVAPTIVALITDYVFHDPGKIAYSLAIVAAVGTAIAAWLGFETIPHFRRIIETGDGEVTPAAAPAAAP